MFTMEPALICRKPVLKVSQVISSTSLGVMSVPMKRARMSGLRKRMALRAQFASGILSSRRTSCQASRTCSLDSSVVLV